MTDRRDILKESLAAIERLKARVAASEGAKHEAIAIVGAGCRYPGGIVSPDDLWRVVRDGVDAVSEVPADRWDAAAYYDPDPKASGKMVTKRGGFLSQVDRFDPQFFGISPREAATMDPQQRLLLETAVEAIERAGIATDKLSGTATGVFVGITTSDYGQILRDGGPENSDVYSATGAALNAASGRIAFTFGLQGPCLSLDTACSSSLVAVHLACQSLRNRESNLALAGGVNVVLSPDAMVLFSKWGMMAPDGACKTFDATADGFVRAEGCAVIALKRLSDAIADGDPILAVIRGSAVNSDGRSSGLTVPNGPAQEAVLRTALSSARLVARDIDYVEAHGTGTSLGDPIEVEALGAVMSEGHTAAQPLLIGSVKTNLGHTEAASGLAGLLKVVMSLQHEHIPPHLHFTQPSPGIPWADFPIAVPTKLTAWPRGERVRRAGVSSFGFSGTNAHVILEEAPLRAAPVATDDAVLVPLSARDDVALRALARKHADFIDANPHVPVADIAATTGIGRAHARCRLAVVARSEAELARDLRSFANGELAPSIVEGKLRPGERAKVAFLFTGQGAQYAGMARTLYDTEPVFRAVIDRASAALEVSLGQPLLDVLYPAHGATTPLSETRFTQPALFALEFALAELWRSWGITPAVVLGHSVGEYVAACVAGVFSFDDGLALIAERGRLMQALPPGGAMAAVFAAESLVAPYVTPRAARVSIAVLNGAEETVISGDGPMVDEIIAELQEKGIKSRRLDVSHAFHSPLLDPMLDAFEQRAGTVAFSAPHTAFVSNLTGRTLSAGEQLDAGYWRRHARQPVRFASSIATLEAMGVTALLEVGPHPTLLALAARTAPRATWVTAASMRRDRDDRQEMLAALGALYVNGANVNWEAVRAGRGTRRGDLPTYPFQRERFWVTPTPKATRDDDNATHPLLGTRHELANAPGTFVWQRRVSLETHPWLTDHRVQDAAIVPATAYIEMAFAAGVEVLDAASLAVRDIVNLKPLLLHEGATRDIQTTLIAETDGGARFSVDSRMAGAARGAPWLRHVTAVVTSLSANAAVPTDADVLSHLEAVRARCSRELEGSAFYKALAIKGNGWGPAFQGMQRVWVGENEAVGRVRVVSDITGEVKRYRFHPALFDACGHVLVATIPIESSESSTGGAFVSGGVGEARFHASPTTEELWVHAALRPATEGERRIVHGDLRVYDDRGTLITETLDARLWYLDDASESDVLGAPVEWLYDVQWEAHAGGESGKRAAVEGNWLVIGDYRALGEAMARETSASVQHADFDVANFDELLVGSNAPSVVVFVVRGDAHDAINGSVVRRAHLDALVRLTQAMVATTTRPRPRVWIVTVGAQSVAAGDVVVSPWGTALWGLGRTLSAEHTEMWGGLVDLDPRAAAAHSASLLVREIANADGEDKLAFRDDGRFVPRLCRLPPTTGERVVSPRSDATYVVTGGLGGIGLATAQWLSRHGARHLLLIARTVVPHRDAWNAIDAESAMGKRIAAIRQLESEGVRVETVSMDIADGSALEHALHARRARGEPPVRGVIHAAGVLQFKAIAETDAATLQDLAAAKGDGAWNLHSATQHESLDFFVLCSSSSTLLSSPLLGGYAAANGFLDGLAHFRRTLGQPALSVNWGTWGEVGMAVEGGRSMSGGMLRGMGTISTARGLAALQSLLDRDTVQAGVLPINWSELAGGYAAIGADPFFSKFIGEAAHALQSEGTATFSLAEFRLAGAAAGERMVCEHIQREAARVLGMAAAQLDTVVPLSAYGFDSLMAVQLKNRLETDLDVVVPMVQFLQGPSVEALSTLVVKELVTHAGATVRAEEDFEEGSL